jgi:hypothetical protein
MVEVMREKVNNTMVVEYFIDELDKSLSKREFKYIWNEISRRNFFYERHIQLSDLETDIRNDSKFLEEEKKREDQERELAIKEKKRLKDKYGDWF